MEKKHYFLSKKPDSSAYPSWKLAFPDLIHCLQENQIPEESVDVIWIVSTVKGWEETVPLFQKKGKNVVVLSMQPNTEEAFRAFSVGARGYGHALSSPTILKQIDSVIAQGGLWVGPDLFMGLMQLSQGNNTTTVNPESEHGSTLSEREREVADQVVKGLSNKEIARELNITERTVKAHLGAIFRKLDIRDRIQLVLRFKSGAS